MSPKKEVSLGYKLRYIDGFRGTKSTPLKNMDLKLLIISDIAGWVQVPPRVLRMKAVSEMKRLFLYTYTSCFFKELN